MTQRETYAPARSPRRRRRRRRRSPLRRLLPLGIAALALVILIAALSTRSDPAHDPIHSDAPADPDALVVCVDPGHGGSDQGADYDGRLEKDDTLKVGLALQQALEERGFTVVMTRDDDSHITLADRVSCASEAGADYYIALHRNYAEVTAYGIEVWVAQGCSDTTLSLAQLVEDGLNQVGVQRDRGVRAGTQSGDGDYYVLRNTSMPAILIELGFLQDEEDNRLLDKYCDDYAAAIADAVQSVAEAQQAGE